MQRLLDDFDSVFDLRQEVRGVPLRDLVRRTILELEPRPLPDWGTEGERGEVAAVSERFVRFYYRPHLFPGMELKLRLAHHLQFHLLPDHVPSGAPVDVAAVLESYCHLSGDLFGWKMLRDGKFLVWIVDMSGHGVQAGLASAVLRVLVDNLRERSRVGKLVTELNRTLEGCVREEHYGLYATAFFLAIDREGRASYCSAGHPPVLVRRADGRIERLEAGEKPIGLFRDTRYEAVPIALAREDIVLMYTDGLVETVGRDGEPFGVDRLRDVLSGRFDRPEAVTGAIYREIAARQNVDELEDDITFLAMKIGPDAGGGPVST